MLLDVPEGPVGGVDGPLDVRFRGDDQADDPATGLARVLASSGVGSATAIVMPCLDVDRHGQVGAGHALGQRGDRLGRRRLLGEVDHRDVELVDRALARSRSPIAPSSTSRADPLARGRLLEQRLGELVVGDELRSHQELAQEHAGARRDRVVRAVESGRDRVASEDVTSSVVESLRNFIPTPIVDWRSGRGGRRP